jgi:potassium channel subfamily K member 1
MSCKINKSTIRLICLCVFYLLYLFIGAAIFSAIEYSNEKDIIENLKSKRQEFFQKHKGCLTGKTNESSSLLQQSHYQFFNLSLDSDLEAFIARIVAANSRGISAIENLTVEPNWSYGQAVFFSGTVLTTIGYGHVSPLSPSGKVFCILYALFGIPMTLILISACVERLLIVTNKLYDSMKQARVFVNSLNIVNLQMLTYTHLSIVFLFVFIVFFIIPAAIFSSVEKDWDYLDALYYCFISLTTIGLGILKLSLI